ncbi:hypothetical protein [Pengzhenrongella sp.]|jgi:hypothetical protein
MADDEEDSTSDPDPTTPLTFDEKLVRWLRAAPDGQRIYFANPPMDEEP